MGRLSVGNRNRMWAMLLMSFIVAMAGMMCFSSGCAGARELDLMMPSTGSANAVNHFTREMAFPESVTIEVPSPPAFHPVDGGSISASGDPIETPPVEIHYHYHEGNMSQSATATDGGGGGLGNEVRPTSPVTTPNSETPTEPTPESPSSTEESTPLQPDSNGISEPEAG